MSGTECCYSGCKKSYSTDKDVSFFSFPDDPKRRAKWMQNCGNDDVKNLSDRQLRRQRICSDHFTLKSFQRPESRTSLIDSAVPLVAKALPGKKRKETLEIAKSEEKKAPLGKKQKETPEVAKLEEKRAPRGRKRKETPEIAKPAEKKAPLGKKRKEIPEVDKSVEKSVSPGKERKETPEVAKSVEKPASLGKKKEAPEVAKPEVKPTLPGEERKETADVAKSEEKRAPRRKKRNETPEVAKSVEQPVSPGKKHKEIPEGVKSAEKSAPLGRKRKETPEVAKSVEGPKPISPGKERKEIPEVAKSAKKPAPLGKETKETPEVAKSVVKATLTGKEPKEISEVVKSAEKPAPLGKKRKEITEVAKSVVKPTLAGKKQESPDVAKSEEKKAPLGKKRKEIPEVAKSAKKLSPLGKKNQIPEVAKSDEKKAPLGKKRNETPEVAKSVEQPVSPGKKHNEIPEGVKSAEKSAPLGRKRKETPEVAKSVEEPKPVSPGKERKEIPEVAKSAEKKAPLGKKTKETLEGAISVVKPNLAGKKRKGTSEIVKSEEKKAPLGKKTKETPEVAKSAAKPAPLGKKTKETPKSAELKEKPTPTEESVPPKVFKTTLYSQIHDHVPQVGPCDDNVSEADSYDEYLYYDRDFEEAYCEEEGDSSRMDREFERFHATLKKFLRLSGKWTMGGVQWDPQGKRKVIVISEPEIPPSGRPCVKRCLQFFEDKAIRVFVDGLDMTDVFGMTCYAEKEDIAALICRVAEASSCNGVPEMVLDDLPSFPSAMKRNSTYFDSECPGVIPNDAYDPICSSCRHLQSLVLENRAKERERFMERRIRSQEKEFQHSFGRSLYSMFSDLVDETDPTKPRKKRTKETFFRKFLHDTRYKFNGDGTRTERVYIEKPISVESVSASFQDIVSKLGFNMANGKKIKSTDSSLHRSTPSSSVVRAAGRITTSGSGVVKVERKLPVQLEHILPFSAGSSFTLDDGQEYELIGEVDASGTQLVEMKPTPAPQYEIIEVDDETLEKLASSKNPVVVLPESSSPANSSNLQVTRIDANDPNLSQILKAINTSHGFKLT